MSTVNPTSDLFVVQVAADAKRVATASHDSLGEILAGTASKSQLAVWIEGSVPDRSEVESAKSITVGGGIEAAKVVAGEDVVVRGGIQGRNAGFVRAHGSIYTRFAANANLLAHGDIHVVAELINGYAWTDAELRGGGASVVGAFVYARLGGEIGVLGSDAFTPTRIFMGASPTELAEAQAIAERVSKARQAVQYTRDRVQPLLDNMRRLSPAQREQATELIYKAEEAEAQIADDEKRRASLLSGCAPKLVVRERIFPGATLGIHSRTVAFRKGMTGPLSLELRKIKNATQFATVNLSTNAVQVLPARDEPIADLVLEFEPLALLHRNSVASTTGPVAP